MAKFYLQVTLQQISIQVSLVERLLEGLNDVVLSYYFMIIQGPLKQMDGIATNVNFPNGFPVLLNMVIFNNLVQQMTSIAHFIYYSTHLKACFKIIHYIFKVLAKTTSCPVHLLQRSFDNTTEYKLDGLGFRAFKWYCFFSIIHFMSKIKI